MGGDEPQTRLCTATILLLASQHPEVFSGSGWLPLGATRGKGGSAIGLALEMKEGEVTAQFRDRKQASSLAG